MAFESLGDKLQDIFKRLKGVGKLSEEDVKSVMREVKMALLEADVNFKVVKDFIAAITQRVVGQEVLESLTPGQQVIKIVNEELTSLMGSTNSKITFSSKPPTVIMMVGLQGAGKTTTCGKLALNLRKQGKAPLLVACDVYRPAAIKQLQVVGAQIGIDVFEIGDQKTPVEISKSAIDYAFKNMKDVIIIDTAGRLHIDETLMTELVDIKKGVRPQEILLVVDSMTGQDAVNVAQSFSEKVGIDGVILTKLDGDTRGGAALSIKAVTQKPIKFIGMGEKLDDLEAFHPDRMASRILGMGDMLSLIEKAEANFDEAKSAELEQKLRKQQFTLDDFLEQISQIKKMGSISSLLSMIPGIGKINEEDIDESELGRTEAIIRSMTKKERDDPSILNGSRRKRIAAGSGTSVQQVNRLMKNYEQSKVMMKQLSGGSGKGFKNGKRKNPFFK